MRRVDGMTVARLTLGDLSFCHVLPASYDVGIGRQRSAEAIRVGQPTDKGPNLSAKVRASFCQA